jgi:LPS sulfotransferase NodH
VPRYGREWFEDAPHIDLDPFIDAHTERSAPPYSDLRGIDYAAHLTRTLNDGTGANGVFGAKIMWGHVDDPHAFFTNLLGHAPSYIWVRRYDTPRQAVSLWRAIQTGTWRGGGASAKTPGFSFEAIDHLVTLLKDHDTAWAQYFAAKDLDPLTLRYREIAADPASAVSAVLDHVGIAEAPQPVEAPLQRQADRTNDEWLNRYNEMRSTSAT